MSMLEKRSNGALASSSASGTVGKGLAVAGTGTLAVSAAAWLLPGGIILWAVVFILAGLFLAEH